MGLDMSLARLSSTSTPFTPASLSPNAWYDPSDLTTLYQTGTRASPGAAVAADGDPVGLMLDKSGNNADLAQITAARRAIYKTAGGLRWLEFDGVDDYIFTPLVLSQPYDRLTSMRIDTWAGNRYMLDGNTDQAVLRQNGASPNVSQYAGGVGADNGAMSLGAAHVVTEHFEGASSILKIDSTSVATSVGASGTTFFTIGAAPAPGNYAPIKFYGGILKAGTMSAGDLAKAQAYLAGKAGI